jgi:signal transduction histidine kinase
MVGSAVDYLRRPWVYVLITLIWLAMSLPFYLLYGFANAFGWGVPFLAAVVFVAVFTQMAVSEQQARLELAKANQKLREYAAQAEELAVIRERNRLAREIHDGLGHYLTAINIQIKAAQATARQDPSLAVNALDNAQSLSEEALADVRRSISALRADPTSNRPIADTLKGLLEEAARSGLETGLAVEGAARALPEQIEFTLYRVAQEGLTNVRKHSQARRVSLCLAYLDGIVRLSLQDDGIGAEQTQGGFGLMGLQERVELLGGSLRVETALGKGFILQAELPAG